MKKGPNGIRTHVGGIKEFIQELKETGCLAPKVPNEITTAAGNALSEELGAEWAVLFIPVEAYDRIDCVQQTFLGIFFSSSDDSCFRFVQ